ncbi:hypothetical protein BJ546DRAFT_954584 [Cryomyces antarcticus]
MSSRPHEQYILDVKSVLRHFWHHERSPTSRGSTKEDKAPYYIMASKNPFQVRQREAPNTSTGSSTSTCSIRGGLDDCAENARDADGVVGEECPISLLGAQTKPLSVPVVIGELLSFVCASTKSGVHGTQKHTVLRLAFLLLDHMIRDLLHRLEESGRKKLLDQEFTTQPVPWYMSSWIASELPSHRTATLVSRDLFEQRQVWR